MDAAPDSFPLPTNFHISQEQMERFFSRIPVGCGKSYFVRENMRKWGITPRHSLTREIWIAQVSQIAIDKYHLTGNPIEFAEELAKTYFDKADPGEFFPDEAIKEELSYE